MKKLFLSLALVCGMAVAANAQWWVGGTASFMTSKTEQVNPTQKYSFMPEVGYSFNDQWAVGVSLGYSYMKEGSTMFSLSDLPGFSSMYAMGAPVNIEGYSIKPFARYTFLSGRAGSLFVDGGVGYTYYNIHHLGKAHGIDAGFKPGFTFNVVNNFAVVGKFGWLGYSYTGIESGDKTHDYGFDFDMDNVEIGVAYKF